ncbi:MAG TPA: hypothetical protein VGO43_06270 [Pyrinomonadaceae bacterium]|nr:hypothetical protein [Pyrinomonadaceae bacterium]
MRKKVMLTVATLLVFAMAIVAFAYTRTNTDNTMAAASCCCCKGDSCPMKSKDAKTGDAAATDAKASCDCCKGDSCPMKKGDHASMPSGTEMKHDGDMKDCSCSCCHHGDDKEDGPAV